MTAYGPLKVSRVELETSVKADLKPYNCLSSLGYAIVYLFQTLCYMPEGRWFDSQ